MPDRLAMSNSGRNQFSFTVTLNPKLYRFPAEVQYDRTAESLYEYLRMHGPDNKYTYVVELTPNSSNVHFHGIIEFGKPKCQLQARKWLADRFRDSKIYGHKCKLDLITDLKGWIEYITKSLEQTEKLINRRPVIIDELSLLPKGLDKYFCYNLIESEYEFAKLQSNLI